MPERESRRPCSDGREQVHLAQRDPTNPIRTCRDVHANEYGRDHNQHADGKLSATHQNSTIRMNLRGPRESETVPQPPRMRCSIPVRLTGLEVVVTGETQDSDAVNTVGVTI